MIRGWPAGGGAVAFGARAGAAGASRWKTTTTLSPELGRARDDADGAGIASVELAGFLACGPLRVPEVVQAIDQLLVGERLPAATARADGRRPAGTPCRVRRAGARR